MNIDKYKTGDMCMDEPEYKDEEGISYPGAEAFLQTKILGFCGCGDPFRNIKYVGKILRYVHDLKEKVWTDEMYYKEWETEGEKIGLEEALYFAYYCLTEIGLLEHGGAVPGWLTPRGIEFMEDAEEIEEIEELKEGL